MKQVITFSRDASENLMAWWKSLDNNRSDRARLRRCKSHIEVVFEPAFHNLRQRLQAREFQAGQALAHVAGILSHVKNHSADRSFAEQLALTKPGNNQAILSGLRFRRLLAIKERDELFVPLLRVISMLDGTANILSLAD